jgi:hypothetical protein
MRETVIRYLLAGPGTLQQVLVVIAGIAVSAGFLPSPLVGEGAERRSREAGEGLFAVDDKFGEHVFENRRWLLQHVVIPIAQCLEPFSGQRRISRFVAIGRCVLTGVDLDDETLFETDKIKDVILKRNLSPKLEVSELPMAQQPPHRGFRICRDAPHALRKVADRLCYRPMVRFLCHRTPHPPSLCEGTLSHKGRGKYHTRIGIRT